MLVWVLLVSLGCSLFELPLSPLPKPSATLGSLHTSNLRNIADVQPI